MKRIATTTVATVACFAVGVTAAWAIWSRTNTGNGAGLAAALGTPATGNLSVSSSSVSFTVSGGGTPTPSGYRVDRTAPAGSAVVGLCSLGAAGGTCTDSSPIAGQSNTYLAYALLGSQWQSTTPANVTVSVPAATPTVATTFPVASTAYNAARWTAGCTAASDEICGTSTNAASVSVSIRQGTGNWYNGTSFSSGSEVLLAATGTTNWSYPIAGSKFASGQSYTIRAVAGTASASTTFTWDTAAPTAQDVGSANGTGTAGKIEQGDSLTLTFSEAIDPASIVSAWNGSAMNVTVRVTNGTSGGNDTLTVYDASNTTQIPIGSVDLDSTAYVTGDVTFGLSAPRSTMSLSSGALVITLGVVSDSTKIPSSAVSKSKLTWAPSTTPTDLAGNSCTATSKVGGNVQQF